jgi:hypothetical protein
MIPAEISMNRCKAAIHTGFARGIKTMIVRVTLGIPISGLVQPKAKQKVADEKDREHEGDKIRSEVICHDCSN